MSHVIIGETHPKNIFCIAQHEGKGVTNYVSIECSWYIKGVW